MIAEGGSNNAIKCVVQMLSNGGMTIMVHSLVASGHEAKDEEHRAQVDMMAMIVRRMASDSSRILPTFTAMSRRYEQTKGCSK